MVIILETQNNIFELKNVSKVFSGKSGSVKALDDINLEIHKGEIFGIIGMSGAGKSTLVRTLNRLENVSGGQVLFEGRALGGLSQKELRQARQQIAMIFQHFNLLSQKTVIQNVMMPMKIAKYDKKQQRSRAEEMLRIVGLEEKANAWPNQLSGGQKQRVAIARALTTEPKVLLCDEATSALDPKITEEILDLLKRINREMGLTVVIITHEMSVVEKICDRVAIIDHGTLAEIGDVKRIFTAPESEAAKRLVFPVNQTVNPFDGSGSRCVRIAFDGRSANEPVIADLTEKTGEKVSILCANTRSVGGIGFGQMIIALPDTAEGQKKVLDYFDSIGLAVSEVTGEEEA